MVKTIARTPAIALDAPEFVRLSSWMAAFNRDVPARVLAAIAAGRGFVLVSGPGGVTVEQRRAIVQRLDEADLVTLEQAAPLGPLAALHDSIRGAMQNGAGKSVVLLIDEAEALDVGVVRRLLALAALKRAGEPVLNILLLATPAVQPLLREAALEALWDDAAAHFRLVPDLAACLPESPPAAASEQARPRQAAARPGTWLPPPRLILPPGRFTQRSSTWGTAAWASCAIAVAALAYVWSGGPTPAPKIVPAPLAPRPAFASPMPAAPIHAAPIHAAPVPAAPVPAVPTPAAPALVRLAPTPTPKPLPKPVPMPPSPTPLPARTAPSGAITLHVTVRYRQGDMQAAAAATRILSRLRDADVLASGPLPASANRPEVSYGFAQDQAAAAALAKRFHLASPQPASGSALARPGEIGLFLGAAHTQPGSSK